MSEVMPVLLLAMTLAVLEAETYILTSNNRLREQICMKQRT